MKLKVRQSKGQHVEVHEIREDFIRLDALLKFAVAAETGGEAKMMIQNGEITVNREVCTQRGKKIRPGDLVRCGDRVMTVRKKSEDE